ncbi:MAG: Gfo/Idh/MocA family oxidoreductase [Chloroflexota bacterium]|nr:Gfo/Idh/MocA family oxidoreductase [Chloroflexota bacterium]MDE2839718.1 Gfo/Idh/MocA family oxidoreductase [Chloroflexota bacterium]MDE2931034.1 Gfo/Idh/MocA family oxidoreductase [Chloroflexota bacterium]
MSTKLRVGIIGVGGNGGRFLDAYATNPRVEVIAICDTRDEHRQAQQEKYHVPHGYADVDALLKHDEIDLVSIHAPDWLHAPFTLAGLDAGKHVFVEKPMATSVEDCLEMVARADAAPTRVAVGHVLRTRPYFRMLKAMVEAGEIGEIYAMRSHYLTNPMHRSASFQEIAHRSYSLPMLTMGVHPVDLMRWYAGDIVEVQAMESRDMALPGNPRDESVTALYRFAGGATGSITVCWASNYIFDSDYGLELHGSEASVARGEVHRRGTFEREPLPEPPQDTREGYAAEVDSVVDSLLDETPLFCDVHEGARSAIACLMAIEAAKTGKTLAVPNP